MGKHVGEKIFDNRPLDQVVPREKSVRRVNF